MINVKMCYYFQLPCRLQHNVVAAGDVDVGAVGHGADGVAAEAAIAGALPRPVHHVHRQEELRGDQGLQLVRQASL